MAKNEGLTPKQLQFVREFCLSFNATDAAKKAGYAAKTAKEQGSRLLTNVNVQAEIKAFQKEAANKYAVTKEAVIEELAHLAFGRGSDVLEWTGEDVKLIPQEEMSERGKAFIDSVHVERGFIKPKKTNDGEPPAEPTFYIKNLKVTTLANQKKAALELLGKHLGMWKDSNAGAGNGTDSDSRKAVLARLQQLVRKRGVPGGEGPSSLG